MTEDLHEFISNRKKEQARVKQSLVAKSRRGTNSFELGQTKLE